MNNLKAHLMTAPDSQLDRTIRDHIAERWDESPSALQILEVLDRCVHASLASSLVVMTLDVMLNQAMKAENISMPELETKATWRSAWN